MANPKITRNLSDIISNIVSFLQLDSLCDRIKKPKGAWHLFGFFVLILTVAIGGCLSFIYREMMREQLLLPKEHLAPFIQYFEKFRDDVLTYSDGEYPMVVDGEPILFAELQQALDYEEVIWESRGRDWQVQGFITSMQKEKEMLIDRLVERKLIEQLADEHGIAEPTADDIEDMAVRLFGEDYRLSEPVSHPEFQIRVRTLVLKDKLDQLLTKEYTGTLFYIKFQSPEADEMLKNGIDPKIEAKEEIEKIYHLVREGAASAEIMDLFNNDADILELNGDSRPEEFRNVSIEDLRLPSPEFRERIVGLFAGELSEIFALTAIMRPDADSYEEFAFGFIELESVTGEIPDNLQSLLDQIKEDAIIEINI